MKMRLIFCLVIVLAVFPLTSYGHNDHDHKEAHDEKAGKHHEEGRDSHDHDSHEEEEAGHDSHEEHKESPSGASFRPGKGVSITDETRAILGLESATAVEEKLPQEIRCSVQVYGDPHHFPGIDPERTGCDIHGSGFLTEEKASLIQPDQKVVLKEPGGQVLEGFVVAIQKATAIGEAEVIIGVLNAESKLKDGQFFEAAISLPRDEAVIAVPKEAVLKTLEGTFVYVLKDDYFLRTAVKVGNTIDGKTEVMEGIAPGDVVVTKPVETLWLIELRATKGGGHSH